MQLARFLIVVMSTVWKETHAYSINGVHLISRHLCDSPNHQIKAIAKYTTHTVTVSSLLFSLLIGQVYYME